MSTTSVSYLGIIQARMGSSRLPGKSMMLIEDRPLLAWVIERVLSSQHLSKNNVVVATSTLAEDDIIANFCNTIGIKVFRGHPTHVFSRYREVIESHNKEGESLYIVRATGDNPLVFPEIIDDYFSRIEQAEADYLYDGLGDKPKYPLGTSVEVFSGNRFLQFADTFPLDEGIIEHVTPLFIKNPEARIIHNPAIKKNYSSYRLTVDTKQDLELMRKLWPRVKRLGLAEFLDRLEDYRDYFKINSAVEQKTEGKS